MTLNQVYQCTQPRCGFRFPVSPNYSGRMCCPKCGGSVNLVTEPYPAHASQGAQLSAGPHVEALLDNIRSTYNVGAIFRSADGAGLRRLHLCGITPTPLNPKVEKTALGAQAAVPWEAHWNAVEAAQALSQAGMRLWALEGGGRSIPLFDSLPDIPGSPIVLVVGNEITGVDPGILAVCERSVWIPMEGIKKSLNVAVAFGIAAYFLRFATQLGPPPNSNTDN